jgi:hypothetical protein
MCSVDERELFAAAYHEAGHVVIAHSLNCQVDGLDVFWSDLGRWFGCSPIVLTTEKLDGLQVEMQMASLSVNGAKAAVAGMLAQTKFLASQQDGEEVQFDASSDLSEMVVFLRSNKRTEESPGCVVVCVLIGSSKEKKKLEFSGLCFSAADSKWFNSNLMRSGRSDPETLVGETMQMLNDEATWAKVKKLATLVLRQPPTGAEKRRSLNASQLREALTTNG